LFPAAALNRRKKTPAPHRNGPGPRVVTTPETFRCRHRSSGGSDRPMDRPLLNGTRSETIPLSKFLTDKNIATTAALPSQIMRWLVFVDVAPRASRSDGR